MDTGPTPNEPTPPETPTTPPEVTQPAAPAPASTPESAPMASPAPAGPMPMGSMGPTPSPEPGKGSNKKLFILIGAIVGGLVVLGLAAWAVYAMFFSASKEDYYQASRDFSQLNLANIEYNSSARSVSTSAINESDALYEASQKEYDDALAALKDKNDTLAKNKAVRVGEGAKLYGDFNKKLQDSLKTMSDLVDSFEKARPAFLTCDKVTGADDQDARVALMKECASEINNVGDVPSAPLEKYLKTAGDGYADLAQIYEKIAALDSPYGSDYETYKQLRDQMYDVQDTVSEASTLMYKELGTLSSSDDLEDAADALSDYLRKQSS